MQTQTDPRLHRASRTGARAFAAFAACLAVTAAWSSQVAGGNIGKAVNTGATSTSTVKPDSAPPAAPATPAKPAARASSAASAPKR